MKHTIKEIKNLVDDAQNATWIDQWGNVLEFDKKNSNYPRVYEGLKKGKIDVSRFSPDQSIKQQLQRSMADDVFEKTIDIEMVPQYSKDTSTIKGIYHIQLPDFKRIQLELDFDVIVKEFDIREKAKFYVEIQEKDPISNEWVSAETIKQSPLQRNRDQKRIFEIKDAEKDNNMITYIPHSYVAVLSKWAGKEVRIALVSEITPIDYLSKIGRWNNARLVGSTFDIKLVTD